MSDILKPAAVLLVICLIASMSLALVSEVTKAPIEKMRIEEETNAQKRLFPDAESFEDIDIESEAEKIVKAKSADADMGYIINVSPLGFGGSISLAVAFGEDGSVSGVEVLSQEETPGLGTKITEPEFKEQYIGSAGPFAVTKSARKNDTEIEAITSATISSTAVTDGINKAIEIFNSIK